jgi:hypothetical protein
MNKNIHSPQNRNMDEKHALELAAIRGVVSGSMALEWGQYRCTTGQAQQVAIAMSQVFGHDRDARIRILGLLLPMDYTDFWGTPASSKDLTCAAASVLIEQLYGLGPQDTIESKEYKIAPHMQELLECLANG